MARLNKTTTFALYFYMLCLMHLRLTIVFVAVNDEELDLSIKTHNSKYFPVQIPITAICYLRMNSRIIISPIHLFAM